MRINILLFVSLTITLLLLSLLLRPLGDVFIVKVYLGYLLLDKVGSLPFNPIGGYWSIVLLNFRPLSIVEYSIFTYVTGLPADFSLFLPVYALSMLLLTNAIGVIGTRNLLKTRKTEKQIVFSIASSMIVLNGVHFFTINGYHTLSLVYLILSVYLMFQYLLTHRTVTLVPLIIISVPILLTHQYATGIYIALTLAMMFTHILISLKNKGIDRVDFSLLPLLIIVLLLELYILPDLNVLTEMGSINDIVYRVIEGIKVTIFKASRIGVEERPHLKYISVLKENHPILTFWEIIEGFTKYLLMILGFLYGFTPLFREYNTEVKGQSRFKLALLVLSIAVLAPAMVYSVYYGALVILAPWVYTLLLTPILIHTYVEEKHEKRAAYLLKKFIRYTVLGLVTLSAIFTIASRWELIQIKGEVNDGTTLHLGKIIGEYLYPGSFRMILSDHTTSANLFMGSITELYESNRILTDNIVFMPFGDLAYKLNCTHIKDIPRNSLIIFAWNNLQYGLFGEVAQYYVPPECICFHKIFDKYSLIISTNKNIVFLI